MNKKSQKTQLKIEQAMFELLKEKPYAELTVAEIAQRAMVSRMAFYRNFGGKDAILTRFLQQEFAAFIQDIKEHDLNSLEQQLTAYLSHFKNNPDLMRVLLKAGFEGELLNQQTAYLHRLLIEYHPELDLSDYAISYQSGGIYMLLVWWVNDDFTAPVELLVDYARRHIMLNK
ncbi:TetR/AcrR family transcriptional regulator [Limosilactobacillus mucosae]|uniref:TetR/AcrR family transcriptional regulator n=1 Tax=Limosilactobacillus mucosae TaxID=97478 RepID=UPI0022DE9B97|nr:TetR/AcrR family transcriptional regulator [Limosilactobacillus mucosae]